MLKKNFSLIYLSLLAFIAFGITAEPMDTSIILDASYVVCKDTSENIHGLSCPYSGTATFYTFDGNALEVVSYDNNPHLLKEKLDPSAPMPQPVSCKIKYFPTPERIKLNSREYVIFYDINDNPIASYRYKNGEISNNKDNTFYVKPVSELQDLDLSLAQDALVYQTIRTEFKHQLYQQQESLMDKDDYMLFIEPYIQEAEESLAIMQHFMKHPHSLLCKKYFKCLQGYIAASFHEYLRSNKDTKSMLDQSNEQLVSIILEIKEANNLKDLDVFQEWIKTKALFLKEKKRYYKVLPKRKKFSLFFSKYF